MDLETDYDELKKDHYFQKKIHPYPYFLQKIYDMDGNIRQTSLPRNACSHPSSYIGIQTQPSGE